jgi:hypothetical protein
MFSFLMVFELQRSLLEMYLYSRPNGNKKEMCSEMTLGRVDPLPVVGI